jgi:hypothetical protein
VVTDKTGVQGRYDFAVKWMPKSGAALVNGGTDGSAISPDSGPILTTTPVAASSMPKKAKVPCNR